MVQSRIHPSRLTQTERKEISDSRMLDAAVDLIVETGAEKLTLKAVGEKAGYSRGLAGYRFGNKTGLFEFVLRSVGDQWRSELTRVCQGLTGKQAISAALQAHQNLCEAAPENVEAFYRLWFDALTPESSLASLIQAIQACRRDDVRGWIEAGRNRERCLHRWMPLLRRGFLSFCGWHRISVDWRSK